ncbi:MAG: glutamate-5-semialdehyde dehydrogenase [Proteobacteria bacterium]|nr:glutamate-5-semialdehyde dehydrogenase [Pseudomonadota bacterium]
MATKMEVAVKARRISSRLANLDDISKNNILSKIREKIKTNHQSILNANIKDVEIATGMLQRGELSKPLVDRLKLNDEKVEQLSTYLEEVEKLPNPVGTKQFSIKLANNLELERISCPLGVVAIIFESRPEVVIQVTALSLKSGNAVILKGGKEAGNSNRILFELIEEALIELDLDGAVNLIEKREDVAVLLDQDQYIDLIIPRGGNDFVRYIQENSKIPVLGHSSGICHVYLDRDCDHQMASKICLDAKTDYPSACNAVETILIHKAEAVQLLPVMAKLLQNNGVKLNGCAKSVEILTDNSTVMDIAMTEEWETEYSDLVVSFKIVNSLDDGIDHINQYGSHHTDSIVTDDNSAAEYFLSRVDSACVFHNASTRFSDGYVFGLGAEVGISTNKTHSRGPVGLDGMIIYKYLLRGNGQIKAQFSGPDSERFLHELLPLN